MAEYNDRWPEQGGEIALPEETVLAFRDQILVPSIDFLAKGSFVADASPRSTFELERTIVDDEGNIRRVKVGAYVELDYPREAGMGDGTRVCSISIATETPEPDQTDTLIEQMVAGGDEPSGQDYEQAVLSAWNATVRFFDVPQEEGSSPNVRSHKDLQDLDGNVLWSNEPDEEEQCSLEGGALTVADLMAIQCALLDLGVDSDIAFPVAKSM
jgi:hypothetical protein